MPDIDVAGARLSFLEEGTGRPVLLIHSTASSGDQWRSLIAHLSRRYRVIAPDLPGNGNSDLPNGRTGHGLGLHADAIGALARHCGEPVHVVGHSFGAAVALRFAVDQPDWIRSLAIVEPAAFHLLGTSSTADRRLFGEIKAVAGTVAAAACSGAPEVGVGHFVDFWNGPGTWQRTGARMRETLTGRIGSILADFSDAFAETWSVDRLRAVHRPMLGLMGTASPAVTRRTTQIVADAVPSAQLHMVLGAGHMLPLTNPEVVDPIITGHLIAADARPMYAGTLPSHQAA